MRSSLFYLIKHATDQGWFKKWWERKDRTLKLYCLKFEEQNKVFWCLLQKKVRLKINLNLIPKRKTDLLRGIISSWLS